MNPLYLHEIEIYKLMIRMMSGNPNRTMFRGFVAIAIGIAIFLVPGLTLKMVIQLLGVLLLVDGIVNFILYKLQKDKKSSIFSIAPRGLSSVLFGLVLVSFPEGMISIFVFLIGFLLIIAGGSQLAAQLGRRSTLGFSLIYTLFGAIGLIAGIVLLVNPFESAEYMMKFFALVIALYGAGEVYWSFQLRKIKTQQPQDVNQPTTIDAEYEEVE